VLHEGIWGSGGRAPRVLIWRSGGELQYVLCVRAKCKPAHMKLEFCAY